MTTTSLTRPSLLAALRETPRWDVIVIGGGATGLGAAVEAANRGYRTVLLERDDFAKGTSSRSTKLVHGGVRYLAQGNVALVRDALRERGRLRRNAPHLVHDLPFVIPAYAWWTMPFYGVGMKVYDLLAGRLSFGPSRWLGARDTLARTPTLKPKGLRGGVLYHDGQFDDARLTVSLVRTFFDQGGVALNYFPVTGLVKEGGRVAGVTGRDVETGEQFTLRAPAVVNATGVFVDAVRRMDEPGVANMLSPSQGVHLVVDQRFQPGDSAVMIPRTSDGRVLFAVPWHQKVVLGTTDTAVERVEEEPRALEEEIDFILRTAAEYLAVAPRREDVRSVYVGLRPLVKGDKAQGGGSTASLSRDHVIRVSEAGLVTITGGKWTTYRKMGEDVVDKVAAVAQLPAKPSGTQDLRLHGWTDAAPPAADADPVAQARHVYGSEAAELARLPEAAHRLHPALPYTEAEVRWAVRHELARTVEDVLSRRTRALLLDAAASAEAAPRVAQILAEELGHPEEWQRRQVATYRELAAGYLLKPLAPAAASQEVVAHRS